MAIKIESMDPRYDQLRLGNGGSGNWNQTINLPFILSGFRLRWTSGLHVMRLYPFEERHLLAKPGEIVDLLTEKERAQHGCAGYMMLGRDFIPLSPRDSHVFQGVLRVTQGILGLCLTDEQRFSFLY